MGQTNPRIAPWVSCVPICWSWCLWEKQDILPQFLDEWNQNRILAIELIVLGDVMFPKTHGSVDLGLLEFRGQIEEGHTFIPNLIADTFRALRIDISTMIVWYIMTIVWYDDSMYKYTRRCLCYAYMKSWDN